MIRLIAIALLATIAFSSFAQTPNPAYNQQLADSIGADKYGMKMYVLVILKTGTADIKEKKVLDSLFGGHMKNIGRLAEMGKLVVAGPLKKNSHNYEGIFIFNVKTIEEATALVSTDPAINAKLLEAEMYQWYGSAALPIYLPYHEKVKKINF